MWLEDVSMEEFERVSERNKCEVEDFTIHCDAKGIWKIWHHGEKKFREELPGQNRRIEYKKSKVGLQIKCVDGVYHHIEQEFLSEFNGVETQKPEKVLARTMENIEANNQYQYKRTVEPESFYSRFFSFKFGENGYKLDNGKYLLNDFSKYSSQLTFILPSLPTSDVFFTPEEIEGIWKNTNLAVGASNDVFEVLRGNYFVSKKGTSCFEVTKQGGHLLIGIGWIHAKDVDLPEEKDIIYKKDRRSNGGRRGTTYFIIPNDYQRKLSIEEI
jgi:hypothetical protein